jgi:hypothetical protein
MSTTETAAIEYDVSRTSYRIGFALDEFKALVPESPPTATRETFLRELLVGAFDASRFVVGLLLCDCAYDACHKLTIVCGKVEVTFNRMDISEMGFLAAVDEVLKLARTPVETIEVVDHEVRYVPEVNFLHETFVLRTTRAIGPGREVIVLVDDNWQVQPALTHNGHTVFALPLDADA